MSIKNSFFSLEKKYEEFLKRTCKSRSTVNYRVGAALRFVIYLFDKKISSLHNISQKDAFDYINFLKDRGFTSHTIWNNARCIHSFIFFLIGEKLINKKEFPDSNEFFKKPKEVRIIDCPDKTEIDALLGILQSNLNSYLNWKSYIIVRLLLLTKLKIKQILELKNMDIDFSRKCIFYGEILIEIDCSDDLINDIEKFMIERDLYVPKNSEYLIRSGNGFQLPYSKEICKNIFKQWRLFASCEINSMAIKRYRHDKLRLTNEISEFKRKTGYGRQYCYRFYPKQMQS